MRVAIYHDFSDELAGLWQSLELAAENSGFQSFEFLKFWYKTIGRSVLGITPWIVVIFESEQPRAIFPFGVRHSLGARVLEFLGGSQADYLGPLVHSDWITDPTNPLLSAWAEMQKFLPAHDIQHFTKIPARWLSDANPLLQVWHTHFFGQAYSASLPADFATFQKRLRTKLKSDNNRQRRRLQEKGRLGFEVIAAQDKRRADFLAVMIQQKRERYRLTGVPDIFAENQVQEFYRKLPTEFSTAGAVHFSVLRLDERILASHWGIVYRDRFYFLLPTFDNGEWKTYSPGRLLLENLMEWSIQNGLQVFDFTIGGEDYKKDWCDGEMPLFESLRLVSVRGILYFCYIRARRYARQNEIMWTVVKKIYSWLQYGKKKAA